MHIADLIYGVVLVLCVEIPVIAFCCVLVAMLTRER